MFAARALLIIPACRRMGERSKCTPSATMIANKMSMATLRGWSDGQVLLLIRGGWRA